jgi:hypothetical protein
MENGFEWPELLSALVLSQHPDEHRSEGPVLLAVNQELAKERLSGFPQSWGTLVRLLDV